MKMISLPSEPQVSQETLERILRMQGYMLMKTGSVEENNSTRMKHVKLYKEFVKLNESEDVLSAKDIVNYITDVTPDSSDVPDYFFKQIKASGKKFLKKIVKIEDLLKTDASLKEYIDSGEERYGENSDSTSDHEPSIEDLNYPIVVFNGEVVDGYNRTAVHHKNGEEYIEAYVSL